MSVRHYSFLTSEKNLPVSPQFKGLTNLILKPTIEQNIIKNIFYVSTIFPSKMISHNTISIPIIVNRIECFRYTQGERQRIPSVSGRG